MSMRSFCNELVYLRNAELHTGEPAFEGRKEFSWLPRYYGAVKALCLFMKRALPDLLDEVAGFYEREVDHTVKNLSSAVEPILIVFVAVVMLIPSVSGAVVSLRAAPLLLGGVGVIVRVMIIWYLFQEPVKERFRAGKKGRPKAAL